MSEELLKAVLQLFAIVVRERVTDEERNNIKEFLGLHLNRESIRYYLGLFDEYCQSQEAETSRQIDSLDPETQQFVDDWAKIMSITRKVNQALTVQQKLVLIVKIIELVFSDLSISERQENLIHYIGKALNISREDVKALRDFVTGQDADELASSNVLIVDEGSDAQAYPGQRIIEKNLTGLIAILHLQDAEVYFIKYLGITALYLNSVPLRSRRIDVFPTGSTIRGDKIEPIYYSDVIGKFLAGESTTRITFTADHLFYHFRSGRAGLQNITLSEQGGKLIGIMGASGSGKSTLLNVLNGTETPSGGRVLINGIDIHAEPERVRGVIGYIPQDDLLIEELTVYQNLYYAARLCCQQTMAETHELVDRVLGTLGLTEIRNLKVGSTLDKIISGGQRKRLNIGLELLREPSVLFVDEPTSGLSSRDSENIMDLLKELSLRGKMIFVVIHQPSSDIFKMFDSLIILDVGGFQIYYGNPIEAVLYFRDIVNAANRSQGACPECGNINPEQIFSIIETKIVNEYGRLTPVRKISAGQWYQYFKQRIKIPKIQHAQEALPVPKLNPSRINQLRIFTTRDVLAKLANKQYFYINLLEAPVLAFFIGYMVRYYNIVGRENPAYTFYGNENIPVYFFMSVVVALFLGLTTSAEEIFRDRKILKREQFLNLSRSSYLISKVGVMFEISAFQTICFVVLSNWILGIPLGELRYWFILFACSCFANMLGLNISSAFNSAVTIYILIPLLIIPQLLLSGIVISFDKFNPNVGKPVGVPTMGNLMASRWAFEAYMVTQFKDNPFEQMFYDYDQVSASSEYKLLYYIPQLESKLAYAVNNHSQWYNRENKTMAASLDLLRTEINHELALVGSDKFEDTDKLRFGRFDSAVYQQTSHFLDVLKKYYANKQNDAIRFRDSLVQVLTETPEKRAVFNIMRLTYENQAVIDLVKNARAIDRIIEYQGRLIRKITPIYQLEYRPLSRIDFSANLFQPTKHFMGRVYDTLYFNITVIWSMTLFLFVTLYFDILRRGVNWLENRRKYRRRNRE